MNNNKVVSNASEAQATATGVQKSSTGQSYTTAAWLDTHFTFMQPEYEQMLRWVGIQPGWRVLDAGSGPGSFLPLMSELVGPGGHIDAMDLAPENVATLKERAVAEAWQAPVTARTGSVVELPYPDNSLDAVWCANVTQYLTDDALRTALREFRRVVRPGGLVAIKDYDVTVQQYHPTPPFFMQHFHEAVLAQNAPAGNAYLRQCFRVVELPRWLRDAGLLEIRQKPTFMLRLQPLSPEGRQFIATSLGYFASLAEKYELPVCEHDVWRRLREVDLPDHILNHPDFQYRCVQTVFVGTVPG